MNRIGFLKTTVLVGVGFQFQLNSELYTLFKIEDIEPKHLLGLCQSHLKSESILLEEETYAAFCSMKSAASKEGIELKIASGYRSFQRQKEIWEWKFKQLTKTMTPTEAISEIITYSSIPGTSRHHWGTDLDLIDASAQPPQGDLLLEENYHGNAPFAKMKSWMDQNSSNFGFELVYTQDKNRTGFNYEPWHYSYKPKSKSYLKLQSQENFKKAWGNLEFEGKSYMNESFINSYFKSYALGINPSLMHS